MTEFAHITPTAYLDLFAAGRPFHLTLAHLIEQDETYANWYAERDLSRGLNPYVNIMDNSAFEMYKEGRDMYPMDKLIEMGTKVGADYIVMSDYPNQPPQVTIDAAIELAPQLREAGFGTFFCPQSEIGDLEGLIAGFEWAAQSEHVDYIGVSILAVPNAYGVEKNNNLQRFMSRWKFMRELHQRGILDAIKDNGKRIHFLGMVDGPNECSLVEDYLYYIDTWDSSAAVWAGMCGISFDESPTGLIDGKNEIEVDFDHNSGDIASIALAMKNIKFIDDQLPSVSGEYYYD
jgi:hypothetical protein